MQDDLALVTASVRKLLSTNSTHPVLATASAYFFGELEGKRFRPMVVLLMAGATNPRGATLTSAVSNVRCRIRR